jgi:hypothetical protein
MSPEYRMLYLSLLNNAPQLTAAGRIKARARFIEKNNPWLAYQRHGHREAALHSTTAGKSGVVCRGIMQKQHGQTVGHTQSTTPKHAARKHEEHCIPVLLRALGPMLSKRDCLKTLQYFLLQL